MYSNNYCKSIFILGGGGGLGRNYLHFYEALEMDKKLGISLQNKGLFRNLALFECFLGLLGRPKKIGFFRHFRAT